MIEQDADIFAVPWSISNGSTMLKVISTLALWFLSISMVFAAGLSEYKLGAGDKIRIFVYDEDDLTIEAVLSDAGTVSYPFLGELSVSGLTLSELESKVVKGLKGGYLVDPKVSIAILSYRQFFINGSVERPGGFDFQPGLTVQKAISLSGGFTERASRRKIFILSEEDVESNGSGRNVKLSDPVSPGDIITVKDGFF